MMYDRWLDVLIKTSLFKKMDVDSINRLLNCLRPKAHTFEKGEYAILAGDPFNGLGVILDGEVNILKENLAGNRVIVNSLKSGDIFGEMVAFSDKNTWPVTVVAAKKTTVIFLPPEKITGHCTKMCVNHLQLTVNMLNLLSNRGMHLNKRLEFLTIKSIREKISTYLLEQYLNSGNTEFNIPLNRNELAEFLNVTRPSLSREMCSMRDEGIIDFQKSRVKIKDLNKLKTFAN